MATLLGIALGLFPLACDSPTSRTEAVCGSGAAAVDPPLLAFLSSARSAHHEADLHEGKGDLRAAVAVLRQLLQQASAGMDRPEVNEVMADTRARLADLTSQLGEFDTAEKDIRAGLELALAPTYFRGHLWEVRGLVEQRRFQSLSARGDANGAAAARSRAIEAFEEAMRIQQAVIQTATSAQPASSVRP